MELLFGDARFMGDATTDVVTGTIPTTATLLTSDYLDIDRPDPTIYPRGMLLFNTRRSTYGVNSLEVITSHALTLVTQVHIQHFLQKRMHG